MWDFVVRYLARVPPTTDFEERVLKHGESLTGREQGRIGARKRIMTDAKTRSARKLLSQGTPPTEVAASLGV